MLRSEKNERSEEENLAVETLYRSAPIHIRPPDVTRQPAFCFSETEILLLERDD